MICWLKKSLQLYWSLIELRNVFRKMGIPEDIIVLIWNFSGSNSMDTTGKIDWVQVGKGVIWDILSPYLFNRFVEYIFGEARLEDESDFRTGGRKGVTFSGENGIVIT